MGPARPKAGIRTSTARGFTAEMTSQSSRSFSMTRGVKFSTTRSTSAHQPQQQIASLILREVKR